MNIAETLKSSDLNVQKIAKEVLKAKHLVGDFLDIDCGDSILVNMKTGEVLVGVFANLGKTKQDFEGELNPIWTPMGYTVDGKTVSCTSEDAIEDYINNNDLTDEQLTLSLNGEIVI